VSELKFETAGVLGTGLVSGLFATTRVERVGLEHYHRFKEQGEPVIFVFWHGLLLPLVYYCRNWGAVVLVSEHADGEYITRVIERLGFGTVRGSSTRGGTKGLKGLIRAARAGKDLALTPDGPQGPARVLKPGALAVAQATGLPILPVGVGTSRGWRFKSWDDFLVPRPFSKVRIHFGPPRWVPREADRDTLDRWAREIGADIDALTERANVGDAP
jgi:lysophospholipid acyltransferase (LPLAT)-like uncharacterized protein